MSAFVPFKLQSNVGIENSAKVVVSIYSSLAMASEVFSARPPSACVGSEAA